MKKLKNIILILLIIFFLKNLYSKDYSLIIQSTTSTRDSGFYKFILPKYKVIDDIKIKVVASGTGHAILNAKKCDADILLAHDTIAEKLFVKEGFGLYRKELMYNDFILVGPSDFMDFFLNTRNINDVLVKIYKEEFVFISRGDNSGTHKKEIELWKNLNFKINSKEKKWYLETGSGMGASLNIAVNKNGFILTDRATWISFNNKRDHVIFAEGDRILYNYYGIIPINPKKCPKSNIKASEKLINWLLSNDGQKLINSFKKNGEQLFFSNVRKN